MSFPPDVFIIGSQRTGTTNLAFLLDQHPRVALSSPKEPAFFTTNWQRGLDWYRERFPDDLPDVSIDATTWYSVASTDRFPARPEDADSPYEGVPERIFSVNPKARFVYVLRDPAARAYSTYWHYKRERQERRNFRDAVARDPFYLRGSDYVGQLRNFLEYFPIDAFLFLVFEDIVKNLQDAAERCFRFLSVQPPDYRVSESAYYRNPSYQLSGLGDRLDRWMPSRLGPEALLARSSAKSPGSFAALLQRMLTRPIPPISDAERDYVNRTLHGRTAELEEISGLKLDQWNV